jgi:flavin-dependent dehydrogenase
MGGVGELNSVITVHGLGVAGSTLAYIASRMGFKVIGLDIAPRYRKACGDVVTLRGYTRELLKATGSILTFARSFEVRVGGVEVAYIDFKEPVWAMVDKPKLVNTLRYMAEVEGAKILAGRGRIEGGRGLVVDARGPYSHRLEDTVLTVRLIAKTRWEPGLALIDFDVENMGFYWVFPLDDDGSLVNLGVGLMSVRDGSLLKALALRYYRRLRGLEPGVVDFKGAPVAVEAPVKLYDGVAYRVGEAAGLINSTSGEGNRYEIHSAIALAMALDKGGGLLGVYKMLLQGLLDEVTLSRRVLKAVKTLSPKARLTLMRMAPREFWVDWLKGRFTRRTVVRLLGGELLNLARGTRVRELKPQRRNPTL